MNTLRIEILNPKAEQLLKNLADLKLISITKKSEVSFEAILNKLRFKTRTVPSQKEITEEVELVRNNRYGK